MDEVKILDPRGKYTRYNEECPICHKVVNGKSALSNHMKCHYDNTEIALAKLSHSIHETDEISDLLNQVANWVASGGKAELPLAFKYQVERTNAKVIATSVVVLSRASVVVLDLFERLMRIQKLLAKDESDEVLEKLNADAKRRIRRDIVDTLLKIIKIIKDLSSLTTGDTADVKEILMTLVSAIKDNRSALLGTIKGTELIPDDPIEREKLRRSIMITRPDLMDTIG